MNRLFFLKIRGRIEAVIASFVGEYVQFLPDGDSSGRPISPPLHGLVKLYINQRCNNFSYLHYGKRISILLLQTSAQMPTAASCLYLMRAHTRLYVSLNKSHRSVFAFDSRLIDLRALVWAFYYTTLSQYITTKVSGPVMDIVVLYLNMLRYFKNVRNREQSQVQVLDDIFQILFENLTKNISHNNRLQDWLD